MVGRLFEGAFTDRTGAEAALATLTDVDRRGPRGC